MRIIVDEDELWAINDALAMLESTREVLERFCENQIVDNDSIDSYFVNAEEHLNAIEIIVRMFEKAESSIESLSFDYD